LKTVRSEILYKYSRVNADNSCLLPDLKYCGGFQIERLVNAEDMRFGQTTASANRYEVQL